MDPSGPDPEGGRFRALLLAEQYARVGRNVFMRVASETAGEPTPPAARRGVEELLVHLDAAVRELQEALAILGLEPLGLEDPAP